ncbi:uncharacterized protein N7473_001958 [Penicillium subrubescens]|uniref:Uncharacterized protein n=1 Tax=Penicillium subrubescens TaxID=1316194 RepID=A0A1Q5SQN3_9EURO|nr:uncharacterized protein N7473_001958 [Penicillium subrubescens]KAJ5905042.1 hypothetical protein N7473_001958 [Penicillium subrubescens]OKO90307.1 hypothetical protein PENSUB_13440 [Penicillium subrubescens]
MQQFPSGPDEIQVPWEQVPKYSLDALPDPPDDYMFLGRPYNSNWSKIRTPLLYQLRIFAKLFLWGFECGTDSKGAIHKSLAKLNYYMRPEYQFRTQDEMFDLSRDGGPRLLRYTIRPTPFPVSRHYPGLLTEDEMRQLGAEHYARPADAPADLDDKFIFQFLLPPHTPMTLPAIPQPPQLSQLVEGAQQSQAPEPQKYKYLNDFNPNPVREAIEKAMVNLCYKKLERHPHAPTMAPVGTRVAVSNNDLGIVQVGTHTTVSEVRLNPHTHKFDPAGFPFPYRGRGPVWADGSCAIDTVIVIGMLTQAGCTMIDRENGMEEKFTEIEKAYIQVTNMNWDAFDDKVSIELRHSFYNLLCDHIPDIKRGESVPPWVVWAESTRNFAQFQVKYFEEPKDACSMCERVETERIPVVGNCLNPYKQDGDNQGVEMSKLIERAWSLEPIHYSCGYCLEPKGPSRLRYVTELPLRLVVTAGSSFRVLGHTQNQKLVYRDADGNIQTAVYRWMGGVYYKNDHVRVFWNDSERGEFDMGNLRKYDGQDAGGVIIGNVSPYSREERVAPEWLQEGLPVAMYELVINPSQDMLHAAAETITEMSNLIAQDKPFLVQHYPWFPLVERKSPYLPLERILPDTGERYYEKALTPTPEVQQPQNTDMNEVLAEQLAEWRMQSGTDVLESLNAEMEQMDPGLLQRLAHSEPLFSSFNDDPNDLINHLEMWPEAAPPQEGGTTTFPNLPKTPTMPSAPGAPGASKSPYWNWINLSPNKNAKAGGFRSPGEKTVTVVNIRDDCRVGPSPYQLYKVPVKSIKAAMRRLSAAQLQSRSLPKKRSRLEELKDDEAGNKRTMRKSKR